MPEQEAFHNNLERKGLTETILLGGAGVTGKQYGPLFAQAGLPVSAVIDICPQDQATSLGVLGDVEYRQLSSPFETEAVEETLKNHPDAAIYIMTPQSTHTKWLESMVPIILDNGIPLVMEKPLAMDPKEAQSILELIDHNPNLAHLVMAGSYTTFKAAALLGIFGAIDPRSPVLARIKPLDEDTPDFEKTYLDNPHNFGRLNNALCLFIEGRKSTREVVGSYGRKHLAIYPGGGMSGDLLEHPLDPLVRLGIIDAGSTFNRVYLGYTPIGDAASSFPWQVPDKKGVAETEGELTLHGKDNAPVLITYGKRGPEFIGDVRRSKLTFADGTIMEVHYVTASGGKSNIFTIQRPNSSIHSYYLDQDPYISMLQHYQGLWGGNLQGEGGLYAQLVNAFMIGDINNLWREQEPQLFLKEKKYREQKGKAAKEYEERQERDFKSIT